MASNQVVRALPQVVKNSWRRIRVRRRDLLDIQSEPEDRILGAVRRLHLPSFQGLPHSGKILPGAAATFSAGVKRGPDLPAAMTCSNWNASPVLSSARNDGDASFQTIHSQCHDLESYPIGHWALRLRSSRFCKIFFLFPFFTHRQFCSAFNDGQFGGFCGFSW
jgi:hypothetical protein